MPGGGAKLLRMDAERARAYLLALPHVVETMQWGENLVFWVGDKAVGGKMFALVDLDPRDGPVASFAAGAEHAAELCERDGLIPAPYLARAGWVAAQHWSALRDREWSEELKAGHETVLGKLTARTRAALTLPARELGALVAERRLLLARKAKAARDPKK